MKVITICTENYKDGLDFCLPTWFKIKGLEKVCVYADFDYEFPDDRVEVRNCINPTDDWLTVVGGKVKVLKQYIATEQCIRSVFLDIDCYLKADISDVFDFPFDLAVTRLFNEKQASTGVIFFNHNEKVVRFFNEWESRQNLFRSQGIGVRKHNQSYSQLAFSDLLKTLYKKSYLNIFNLSGDIYNSEDDRNDVWRHKVKLYNPKVLHFKARSWRNQELVNQLT